MEAGRRILGAQRFGAADRFLLLIDRELRARGLAGFQAVLAVELEGELDAAARARIAAAFERWLGSEPRGRARLVRRFGVGPLALAPARGAAKFRERELGPADLVASAKERLDAPLDPCREPLVDLVVESARETSRLVLRWWHPVMDERGAELLLRRLSEECGARDVRRREAAVPPRASRGDRWRSFRAARLRLEELTKSAPFVLAAREEGARAVAHGWSLESDRLSTIETAHFLAAADERYGLRGEGLAQVALVFSALAEVAPPDAELALPVSVQLRPPRARAPCCANELTFLWYALPAVVARDRDRCAVSLRALAKAKVLAGEAEEASALLEIGRWLPLPLYRRELTRRDGSSRFSASLSTLGELFAGASELFGRPLRDALALTAFPDPPGLGVVFSRAAGRLGIATLHADDRVDAVAARRLHERIVAAARALAAAR